MLFLIHPIDPTIKRLKKLVKYVGENTIFS